MFQLERTFNPLHVAVQLCGLSLSHCVLNVLLEALSLTLQRLLAFPCNSPDETS